MKNTMKRIMALALILAMIIGVVPSVFAVDYVNHFTDVPTNKWYAEYVEYVNDRGWMNGIGNNLFGPDDTLERAITARPARPQSPLRAPSPTSPPASGTAMLSLGRRRPAS